jgi:hypothetical protein
MLTRRRVLVALGLVVLSIPWAEAAKWSHAYIRQLPDSAFAVIERAPEGQRLRRLPHVTGALDLPHLCNALARLPQVKWRDPANATVARKHLKDHLGQVGPGACRSPLRLGS